MLSEAADTYVSIGDSVFLYDETHGTLGVEGFTDVLTGCYSSSMPVEFGRLCTFRLVPQQMYTLARQLKANLESREMVDPELQLQLTADAKRERSHNESEVQTSTGRSLRYGKILQLQHVASGKQLAVTHQASARHRDARRVSLCEVSEVSEAAWFKIMPKLRVHTEGEKVRSGDPVVFESVMTGLKLHVQHDASLVDGRTEVNASSEASTFKLTIYQQSVHLGAGCVSGGDAIRIMHREANGVLGTSIPRAIAMEDMCILTDASANLSSSSVFIIEKDNPRDGSPCRWEESFRLRHVASGLLLQVGVPADYERVNASSSLTFFTASQMMMNDGASRIQSRTTMRLRVILTSSREAAATLFQFAPQYVNADETAGFATSGGIGFGVLFGIRHVASGLWLHHEEGAAKGADHGAPVPEPEKEEATPEAKGAASLLIKRKQSKGWGALKTMISESQGHGVINAGLGASGNYDTLGQVTSFIVATRERHDEDMFTVRLAPQEQYHDCLYIDSRVRLLKQLLSRFDARNATAASSEAQLVETAAAGGAAEGAAESCGPGPSADAEADAAADTSDLKRSHATVAELIVFATDSDNADPFTREGLPFPLRQMLLTELLLFDVVVDASTKFADAYNARVAADSANALNSFNSNARIVQAENLLTRQSSRQRASGLISMATELQRRKAAKGRQSSGLLLELATLCQRLARHILREHPMNKK